MDPLRHDAVNTRSQPLETRINPTNVNNLAVKWTFTTIVTCPRLQPSPMIQSTSPTGPATYTRYAPVQASFSGRARFPNITASAARFRE